ncbi:MAG: hypothetical protein IIX45_06575 [Lachnospiraceae bacterium]|nr:hypothetical protein [Lachnospiraceae bacterium]
MPKFDFNSMYGNGIDEEEELEYFKRMYPVNVIKLQNIVDEACDRMEYDKSMMYDEYPDFVMVHKKCKELVSQHRVEDERTRDMLEVLFINEIVRRRLRYRKIKGYC